MWAASFCVCLRQQARLHSSVQPGLAIHAVLGASDKLPRGCPDRRRA